MHWWETDTSGYDKLDGIIFIVLTAAFYAIITLASGYYIFSTSTVILSAVPGIIATVILKRVFRKQKVKLV